ncbi:MAG: hypothetical protein M3460_11760 [Actinomycetota bacterium]|nr:hypothetical protein [Actinomycetota bacterium]
MGQSKRTRRLGVEEPEIPPQCGQLRMHAPVRDADVLASIDVGFVADHLEAQVVRQWTAEHMHAATACPQQWCQLPQRLWDRVEEVYAFWQRAGRPAYDRFGITATPIDQYVWCHHPDSEHRWPLPTPTDPQPRTGGPSAATR